jgi:hypothetical protein
MPGPPGDHHFRNARGSILVREGTVQYPWLVTWLPDNQEDPNYPGFTLSSTEADFPTDAGPRAAAEWADRQPWAIDQPLTSPPPAPPDAVPLDVPSDEWSEVRARVASSGWRFGGWREPDGRFSWFVWNDGEVIKSGVADSWDDAKIDSIIDFPPPSDEQ